MPFSVLMSVYAKENPQYLKEALDSVFSQSLPPDEVVLVEDGRLTEGLYAEIRSQQRLHPQLKTVELEENQQGWDRSATRWWPGWIRMILQCGNVLRYSTGI